jgi:hypothetical protein
MLENHVIQTRGFHNTVDKNGNATGFQFCMRANYYKGLWLSQLRISDVTCDGEVYSREKQLWEINGIEYTPDEMLEIGDTEQSTYFQVTDTAAIKLNKPGGLSQGYHTVSIKFGWICNYFPPMLYFDKELGCNLPGYYYERRLLIV